MNGYTMRYYLVFKKKKDFLSHAATWANLKDIVLTVKPSHKKINIAWFHIYEISRVVELLETESRMVVGRNLGNGGGERNRELFNKNRVSVSRDKKSSRPFKGSGKPLWIDQICILKKKITLLQWRGWIAGTSWRQGNQLGCGFGHLNCGGEKWSYLLLLYWCSLPDRHYARSFTQSVGVSSCSLYLCVVEEKICGKNQREQITLIVTNKKSPPKCQEWAPSK